MSAVEAFRERSERSDSKASGAATLFPRFRSDRSNLDKTDFFSSFDKSIGHVKSTTS